MEKLIRCGREIESGLARLLKMKLREVSSGPGSVAEGEVLAPLVKTFRSSRS
ncbi:unnamed protein product [Arabis nemorensis]|uniref:Uncharacterized protein n=1 Tax=Arabis nemorensis TaxID=586526 RepID=A0A565C573_9BRAS|nr:unnamed protein product [Arabis nemorensis]